MTAPGDRTFARPTGGGPRDPVHLRHGELFGIEEVHRDVEGFALSIKHARPWIRVDRHTHEDAHLILLLDGHYVSAARGAGHLHAEPALIYNPPGTTHGDTFPERCGRFLGISISSERFAEAAQLSRRSTSANASRLLRAPGLAIDAAVRVWDPGALAIAHRLADGVHGQSALQLEALCLELVGAFVDGDPGDRRPPAWLIRARELLHDRAIDHISMAEVAAATGVHPVHLARTFRRFFGCSPGDYVRRCRVEQAAVLLRATAQPIVEIAASCGFVDQSHLTRAFGGAFGTSPAAYRRRHTPS